MSESPAPISSLSSSVDARPRSLRFSVFELDLATLELRRSGRRVHLQQQPAKVLSLLARRPGELVTREEIQREVWASDTFVDFEQGLNFCVRQIRTVLGDSAGAPRFVETLPRRGYRFIAPVEALHDPGAALARSKESAPLAASAPGAATNRTAMGRLLVALAVAAVVVLDAPAAWRAGRSASSRSQPGRKPALAVLPFDNLSQDAAYDYLADGLTEETITQVARAAPERLGVIARTTSMRFRGASKSVLEVGRELGVDYVLEGSIRRAGDRLRVTAQLIQAKDETHLWAESYERDLRDVLGVQNEVASRVTGALLDKLLSGIAASGARARTTSAEAYDAYLKGRYHLAKGSEESLRGAIGFFQEAATLDPRFALAHASLAEAWIDLGDGLFVPAQEAYPRARAAATTALSLDPGLAEAWTLLGVVKTYYDWDLVAGPQALDKAVALNPADSRAHHYRADYLSALGRHEEGIAATRRAQALDPLSRPVNEDIGWYYFFARRFREAAVQFRRTAELEPSDSGPHLYAAYAFAALGEWKEALAEARQVVLATGYDAASADRLLAPGGRKAYDAFLRAAVACHREQTTAVRPYSFAMLADLGDREAALRDLQRAREARWRYLLVEVGGDPRLDPLRSDPRFRALERDLGLRE
jgi:TolB-like protein/DNA-binding winged helix-turn-helix (wHTH) protein